MQCRSINSVMCDHSFIFLYLSAVISRGIGAFLSAITAPVTFLNIFILGFEVQVRGANATLSACSHRFWMLMLFSVFTSFSLLHF